MGYSSYKKIEADSLIQISVFWLRQHGFFKGYTRKTLVWSWSPEYTVKISLSCCINEEIKEPSCIFLGQNDQFQRVDFSATECSLGGKRFWFVCSCGRRVGILYLLHGRFACRGCHNLTYESRNLGGKWKHIGKIIPADRLDELKDSLRRYSYKGKPTKRFIRYLKATDRFTSVLKAWTDNLPDYSTKGAL